MDGLKVKVNVNDIIDIYEKEVSVNTKNKSKVYNFEKNKIENIYDIKNIIESDNYKITKYNVFTINNPKYRMVMSLNMKDKIINHYVARFILLPSIFVISAIPLASFVFEPGFVTTQRPRRLKISMSLSDI